MCDQGHDDIITRIEELELVFREHNGDIKAIKSDVGQIKECLVGGIKGNEPGLSERVRTLEKWVGDQKLMFRLIVTVFITQIIGWIFVLLQK